MKLRLFLGILCLLLFTSCDILKEFSAKNKDSIEVQILSSYAKKKLETYLKTKNVVIDESKNSVQLTLPKSDIKPFIQNHLDKFGTSGQIIISYYPSASADSVSFEVVLRKDYNKPRETLQATARLDLESEFVSLKKEQDNIKSVLADIAEQLKLMQKLDTLTNPD
jgi:hypothetical protein